MQNRFSIGEMSRLMNIPIKTLRYYDEIGLFKPIEVNRHTGYRYYSTEQFEQLDIIKYLRLLGIPLSEIREHFTHRRVECFLHLLQRQEASIQEKIHELEMTRRKFGSRIAELENALSGTRTDVPEIRRFPVRKILRLQENVQSGPSLEMSVRKLEKLIGARHSPIFIGKVGLTVSEENMQLNNFHEYSSVFILMEDAEEVMDFSLALPEGEYACLLFRGLHGNSIPHYQSLLNFLSLQGYRIAGESLERAIVDEFISKDKARFLTEIQIPVLQKK